MNTIINIHSFATQTTEYYNLIGTLSDIDNERLESSQASEKSMLYSIALFGFACNIVQLYKRIDNSVFNYGFTKAYTEYLEQLLEKGELK